MQDREEAQRRLLARFKDARRIAIWLSKRPLQAGELTLPIGDLAGDAKGSWVGFADFSPGDPFAHPCAFWFLDPNGDERFNTEEFCPNQLTSLFELIYRQW